MAQGIGTDIIEIHRIRKAVARHGSRFLERIFSHAEIAYCSRYNDPIPHYAGRFAAKEALSKCMGSGIIFEGQWKEIEILNDEQGKPEVHLSQPLRTRFSNMTFLVSISHCKEYATAFALVF